MIKLQHIDKVYDNGFQAVFDFDVEISNNEFVVLVGPSGCGKSTMIRTIAGLENATRGSVIVDGKDVTNAPSDERGIAMVFQSYALYPHLTVAENIGFSLVLAGYDEDFIEERIKAVTQILGLEGLLYRMPRQLSGGQRQRVAVGRAIIRHPQIFLMDEPLSNLDAKHRVLMRSEIVEIHRRTKAITIYVTHDQTEAMTMADRIICMRDGRIQQIGTPHELYFKPKNKFVAGFLGEPPMNFLKALNINGNISIDESIVLNDLNDFNSKSVFVGFRPESAFLSDENITDNYHIFKGKLELKELLGDVCNLYISIGEHNVIIKAPQNTNYIECDDITFYVKLKDFYIFDAITEEILYPYNLLGVL